MTKKNWKVDADYDFTTNLDLNGWAWEFLRRNTEYRQDWENELKSCYQKIPPYKMPDIWADDFSIEPAIIDCREKWQITRFVNPDTDFPIGLEFVNSYGRIYRRPSKVDLSPGSVAKKVDLMPCQVAAVFDLSLPIKRQVEDIRGKLRRWQKIYEKRGVSTVKKPKTQNDLWKSYIRTLDAKASGTKNNKIYKVLYSKTRPQHPDDKGYHNKIVRDAINSAKKLVDGGYRKIISGP